MAEKYYAVKAGRNTGIFNSWEECKESINGYSGALYKSFKNINDAYEYMGWDRNAGPAPDINAVVTDGFGDLLIVNDDKTAIAYVDGSYNADTGFFSYGVVLFTGGNELHFSDKSNDAGLASMRNVAGEIHGSMAAMKYAVSHNCTSLTIFHDYEGVAKWCLGEWKTNKPGTIAYKNYYDSIKNQVNIQFVKVKGHSGDKYNDLADELAKAEIF